MGYKLLARLGNIGKQVNRDAWEMTTPTVNAYYDPSQNGIGAENTGSSIRTYNLLGLCCMLVLPAGILQGLYFNELFHPAINFGGTGGTQGHEMTVCHEVPWLYAEDFVLTAWI